MSVKSLWFTNTGPFDDIRFEFEKHVNVLTGPNNSGKSTALLVLGELLVYPFGLPSKLIRSDGARWELCFGSAHRHQTLTGQLPTFPNDLVAMYESIGYTCFVPAQRYNSDYRSPGPSVGDRIDERARVEADHIAQTWPEIYDDAGPESIRQAMRERHTSLHPELAKRAKLMMAGTSLVSDEDVVQKIVDLDYAGYRRRNPNIHRTIEQIASVSSEITEGFPLAFSDVGEDGRGLFPTVSTQNGELPVGSLSQGTQSIIHCVARILLGYAEYYDFPSDLSDKPGIVIIDEIDAHLHPTWQRRFIPTLRNNFPNLQFFCSTHSPLMLTGLDKGQIQLLRRDGEGRVTISVNESDIDGWTADEVLRNLLEVTDPTDIQTARRLARLQELRSTEGLSPTEAQELETLRRTVGQDLMRSPRLGRAMEFAEELRRTIRGASFEPGERIIDG